MTERVFTDFNLAELKRDLNNQSNPDPTLWEPLIHRLECAEAICQIFVGRKIKLPREQCWRVPAWRKSAGRE